jgi:hypothetical protein
MTVVAHVVEKSSNLACQMSDIIDSDNAYEDFQRLIVSTIAAAETPSPGSSNAENRQWHRTKQMKGKSWTCSGIIIIDILDPVPAAGDDLEMPDQHNPLESRLPRIKSSLHAFMNPIFPQDSLIKPYKYFEVFVECKSLLEPQQGSTFHVHFRAFLQCSKERTNTALKKLIPLSSEFFLIWSLCEGGLWQNEYYQQCIAPGDANPWMSLFSLGTKVLNNAAKHSERKKRKVSSSTII